MNRTGLLVSSRITLLIILISWVGVPHLAGSADIHLNPATTFQTISGWEVTAQAGQQECAGFNNYKNQLFDLTVNDLGINRIRLEVRSGSENPVDYFNQFITGQIPFSQWRPHWYEIINDNSNSTVLAANGFQFSELDHTIDNVVLPLQQRLAARGETLYVNLNVVDFDSNQGQSNVQFQSSPQEYGEFVLATFQHIQSKYGWSPDALEVILEPDVAAWGTGTVVGDALVAAAGRLQAAGFSPDYIVPSNTDMGRAITFFDALAQNSAALNLVTELSYHRYSGVSDANLQTIGSRATQYGINTSMLEHINSGYLDLHQDLKVARVSAWQQFALAFCTTDNGAQYYLINNSNPNSPTVNMASRTYLLRQYFKYVRHGAVRIDATTSNSSFDPLAFINTNGKYVVVIKTTTDGTLAIHDLPAGTYGIKYMTTGLSEGNPPNVTLSAGQVLNTSIPAAGVLTVYAITSTGSTPPSNLLISGPTSGAVNTANTFTASVNPSTTTLPLTYVWQATGQSTLTRVINARTDTVPFTWTSAGAKVITVTASNAAGSASDSHTITINSPSTPTSTPTLTPPPPTPTSTPPAPSPPAGLLISGSNVGAVGIPVTLIASVNSLTTTLPLTYVWQATGQSTLTRVINARSDTVSFTWPSTGAKVVTVSASNAAGSAGDSHPVTVIPPLNEYLPLILKEN